MSAPSTTEVRIAMSAGPLIEEGCKLSMPIGCKWRTLAANARDVAAKLRIIADPHKVWVGMTSEMALQLADQLDPQPQPVSKTP